MRNKRVICAIIHLMMRITGCRDPYTAEHQQHVADLSGAIARTMGLPRDQIEQIHLAGLVHDFGKICVPSEVLCKPGALTRLEFGLIQTHPQICYDLLNPIAMLRPIAEIVRQHQERLDGSGYPQGLSGEHISLASRIITVADVVDAMSSHRPYRPTLGLAKAREELRQHQDTLYDAEVIDAYMQVYADGCYLQDGGHL